MKPALFVRDIDLIKKICLEELEHFSDRVKLFDKEFDSVIGNILVNRTGKEWQAMRSSLNPAFVSSRTKHFFDLISECAETFANHFVNENKSLVEIQLNETFSKFDNDVISSVCFGISSDSLEDDDNEFFKMHKKLKSFGAFQKLKLSLIQLCPLLAKTFFKNIVIATMQKRESENINRPDFIDYLMKLRKKTFVEELGLNDAADHELEIRQPGERSKFALLEIKLLFFHLLSKFDLVPTIKTNPVLNLTRFDVNVVGHTFLGLKPRKVTSL
ncbi:hypothetical protein NQ314_019095 [Rhamnusium bicolor]|uniref:Cytochrome P450 n=1 Tax=Rhamnusium bicolor TaxID=1586634 RepID=A0AAV8WPE0_9CUCU|nr:hypothetical protein NQ314_019095 [Rhamnusium bicolor]